MVVARRVVRTVAAGTGTAVAVAAVVVAHRVVRTVRATGAGTAVAVVVHDTVVAAVIGRVAGLGPNYDAVLHADVRPVGRVANADPLAHGTILELEVDLHAPAALAEVDLDEQAVVLWSSGESGTCASWFAGVSTGPDGAVEVSQDGEGGTCTSDFRPFQVVVAVDLDDLPAPEDLSSARATFAGTDEDFLTLVVSAFPCCSAPG